MSDFESTRRSQPAPASGVLAIILAVVAVVAGFLILRTLSDGGSVTSSGDGAVLDPGGSDTGDGDGTGDEATGGSTSTTTTTTTEPPLTFTGATIIVANANGGSGTAGQASQVISGGTDFEVVDPTNADSDSDLSQIQYDATNPLALPVAQSLAQVLPGSITPVPINGTAPITDGDMKGAGVLLLLGEDLADMTAADLTLPATPAAPAQTAPPVAGSSTTAPPG